MECPICKKEINCHKDQYSCYSCNYYINCYEYGHTERLTYKKYHFFYSQSSTHKVCKIYKELEDYSSNDYSICGKPIFVVNENIIDKIKNIKSDFSIEEFIQNQEILS